MEKMRRILMMSLSVLISFSMMGNTVCAMTAGGEANIVQENIQEQGDAEEHTSEDVPGALGESENGMKETASEEVVANENTTDSDKTEAGEDEADPDESKDGDACENGHTWSEKHKLSVEPAYEDAGTIVHVCTVCGEEEEIEEEDWTEDDYKLAQRRMNLVGTIAIGENKSLTLSTQNDKDYGQYFEFIPEEAGVYEINLDNEDMIGSFQHNDAEISDVEDGEELQANKKYYICIQGTGSGTLRVTKAGQKIDISSGYKILFVDEGPFTVNIDNSPVEPDIEVVPLSDDGDDEVTYQVSYENNTEVGEATVIVTGTGKYTGKVTAHFTVDKMEQESDLSAYSNLSVAEGEEKEIDLRELIGKVTVKSSDDSYVEVTEKEKGVYSVKAVKHGVVTLGITAEGNQYYKKYEGTIKITISKAEHHHTYLLQDENGAYTKYDEKKGEHHEATCQEAEYTIYKCEDKDCGYVERVNGSPELAAHQWGLHQASEDEEKAPTYEDAGVLVHICKVCKEEEEIAKEDWDKEDYKLVQRLKNDVKDKNGKVIAIEEGKDKKQTLELSSYNDDQYGQFLTFVPSKNAAYQINVKEIEGADFEVVFVQDDVGLTEMSSAETLQAGRTYYICVRGNGKCEVSVSEVVKQIDIQKEGYRVKFENGLDNLDNEEFYADGNPIEPEVEEVVPKYEDEEVTYNVTYEENKKPGTATVCITGSGNYTGTIRKNFIIKPGKQTLDIGEITLAEEGNSTELDLSSLIGKIEIIPSKEGIVKVEKEENADAERQIYVVTPLKAGSIKLTVKSAGDSIYGAFETSINVYVSKAEHHHTYLSKDSSGKYTVYKPANGTSIIAYPATCIKPAYTVYKCTDTDCGAEETIVDPKGTLADHTYEQKVVEPTCVSEGYTNEICKVCGYTQIKKDSTKDKLDHNYVYKETIGATADSRAYNVYECENCHIQQREYFGCIGGSTASGKHTFVSQVVKPTCTKGGYTKNTCTVCGYSEVVDETDELGHDMRDTEIKPTVDKYGYIHSECSRCGYFVDTITHCKIRIDKDGKETDVHEGDPITGSESQTDCEKPGTRKYKCRLCKKIYEVEIPNELPAKEHNWEIGEDDAASCEEDGVKTCKNCGKTEAIPKLGHKWIKDEANSRAATYDEKGVNAWKCSNTGCDETKEDYIKRLRDEKGTLSTGSKYLNIPDGKNTHGFYYKFTPTATKNYFVTGNDVFDTVFCEMDDDLTELGSTVLLTKGKTYYVCVSGEGQGNVTISNVTDFIDIKKGNYKIQILDDPSSLVYTGDEIEPGSIRILSPENAELDSDCYSVRYQNNINAGTATVYITGIGKYTGTISKTFTIKKASQDVQEKYFDLQVGEIRELNQWEFFGTSTVKVLSGGEDYVSVIQIEKGYKLYGKKVGTTKLSIHADGDANHNAVDVTIPVTIMAKGHIHAFSAVGEDGNPTGDIDENKIVEMIKQAPSNLAVKGSFTAEDKTTGRKSKVTLISRNCEDGNVYDIECLEDGCNHYTITSYTDDREEVLKEHVYKTHQTADGDIETDGVIKVYPTYDSIGKKEITCTVCGTKTTEDIDCLERVNLRDLEVELSRTYFIYDGKEKRPAVKVLDENEKALASNLYTVTYQNNKNPGVNTAKVIIRAKRNSDPKKDKYCGSATATYSIVQAALNRSKIVAGSSAKLTLRGIYTIDDYEMNRDGIISWNKKTGTVTGKKAGQVKLTIYGYDKDDNDITVSVTVTVLPKATAITKVKPLKKGRIVVSWKKNKTCGGYQVQYTLDKKFKKKVKTVKVTKWAAQSVTIKGLKAKKKYYVRIRAVDSKAAKVVSAWSKVKTVKVK